MYRLEYYNNTRLLESFVFPSKALALWKKKQLMSNGYTLGSFKIVAIK
jgi:hypothetical protein